MNGVTTEIVAESCGCRATRRRRREGARVVDEALAAQHRVQPPRQMRRHRGDRRRIRRRQDGTEHEGDRQRETQDGADARDRRRGRDDETDAQEQDHAQVVAEAVHRDVQRLPVQEGGQEDVEHDLGRQGDLAPLGHEAHEHADRDPRPRRRDLQIRAGQSAGEHGEPEDDRDLEALHERRLLVRRPAVHARQGGGAPPAGTT
jgi:hypothetical protein